MKGIVLDENTGQYNMFKHEKMQQAADEAKLTLVNRSRFGATIEKGYRLLQREFKKLAATEEKLDIPCVIFEYGGNDSDFFWDKVVEDPEREHLPKTPPEKFREIYHAMISFVQERGIEPVLMNLPPIEPSHFLDYICSCYKIARNQVMKFIKKVSTIYHYQEMYSDIVRSVATERKCQLLEIRSSFLESVNCDIKLIGNDGVHPTQEGHHLIDLVCAAYLRSDSIIPERT